jgi:hypothetical protein
MTDSPNARMLRRGVGDGAGAATGAGEGVAHDAPGSTLPAGPPILEAAALARAIAGRGDGG